MTMEQPEQNVPAREETLGESFDRILAEFPRLAEIERSDAPADLEMRQELDQLRTAVESLENLQEVEFPFTDTAGTLRPRVRIISLRRVPGEDWQVKLVDVDDPSWDEVYLPLSAIVNGSLSAFNSDELFDRLHKGAVNPAESQQLAEDLGKAAEEGLAGQ